MFESIRSEIWDDYAEIDEPYGCAYCGKKTYRLYGRVILPIGERYMGNAREVSRATNEAHWDNERVDVVKLNRGTYRELRHGLFCRPKCTAAYAQAAHDAGYRMKRNGK